MDDDNPQPIAIGATNHAGAMTNPRMHAHATTWLAVDAARCRRDMIGCTAVPRDFSSMANAIMPYPACPTCAKAARCSLRAALASRGGTPMAADTPPEVASHRQYWPGLRGTLHPRATRPAHR
jgi:hypothetical protein